MTTLRETNNGRLLEYDGIQFWIQKRWQRADGTLTPAGKKAMAIAADCQRRHSGFDATKTFYVIRKTAAAVLLACQVKVPNETQNVQARFWVPLSMVKNYRFVSQKVEEVENSFPFIGTKVIWPQG
jgi:hypothetical protein